MCKKELGLLIEPKVLNAAIIGVGVFETVLFSRLYIYIDNCDKIFC